MKENTQQSSLKYKKIIEMKDRNGSVAENESTLQWEQQDKHAAPLVSITFAVFFYYVYVN